MQHRALLVSGLIFWQLLGLPAAALAASPLAPQARLQLTETQATLLDDLLFEEMGVRDLLTSKIKYEIDVDAAIRDLDVLNDLSLGISALYQKRPEVAAQSLQRIAKATVVEPDLENLLATYRRFVAGVLPPSALSTPKAASGYEPWQATSAAAEALEHAKTIQAPTKLPNQPNPAGYDKTFRTKLMVGSLFGETPIFAMGGRLGFNLANLAEVGLDYATGIKTGSEVVSGTGITVPTVETLMRFGVSATTQPMFEYLYAGAGANLFMTERGGGQFLDLIAGAKSPSWTLFRVQSLVFESNVGLEGRLGINGPSALMGFLSIDY